MRELVSRIRRFAREAWRELPLETGAVTTAAISLVVAIQGAPFSGSIETWLARLFLAAVLATPLLFSLTLLARAGRIGKGAHLLLGAATAAATLGALAVGLEHVNELDRPAFHWPLGLFAIAALLAPFATVAAGAGPEDRFREFARFLRRFCEQTTAVVLLGAAALAAVGVVFLALSELFDLKVDRLAAHTCVVVIAVFVVGYLSRLLATGDGERVPELWRRLVTGVGVPFVAVMLVILTAYELYVLITQALPRNLLSPLIIAAGTVGFVCTLIIDAILHEQAPRGPLAPAEPHRWAKRHSIRLVRAFPVGLLVLLPMAGWALAVRIEQYGFTPFRVARMMALLCLGVLALLGTIRYFRGRRALTWEVPLCGIAFALAGAWGPVSAVRLSIESQVPRLERLLATAGIDTRDIAAQPTATRVRVAREVYWELTGQIQAVARLGGEAALRRVLGGEVAHCAGAWAGTECLQRLGVARDDMMDHPLRYLTATAAGSFPMPAGHLEFVSLSPGHAHEVTGCTLRIEEDEIHCHGEGRRLGAARLAELLAEWEHAGTLPPVPLAVHDHDGRVLGLLAIDELHITQYPGDRREISSIRGIWMMQRPSGWAGP